MSGFHEVRFLTAIALRSSGGPERRTEVVTLASGHEERNQRWADSRRRYDAGSGVKSLDDIHALVAFFEERRGRMYGFRWKDHFDFRSCPPERVPHPLDQLQTIPVAGPSFRLVKRYGTGDGAWVRAIGKPVAGFVSVAVNGVVLTPGSDFTVDATTGVVTRIGANWSPVDTVTAGFEFDVPVRFDTDRLEVTLDGARAGSVGSVPVVEVRI